MNRRLFNILMTGAVAVFSLSCNQEEIAPDVPDTPAEGKLVRLTFGSTDAPDTRAVWKDETGKGNLIFNWDSDPLGQRMVAVISNGDHFIPNYPASNNWSELQNHTLLTVTPQEDPHYAIFETERYYFENEINTQAKKIFVTSARGNTFSSTLDMFHSSIDMSNLFIQQASQQPDFLREWMMLYGEAEMKNGSALISFKHIPATFRFIITNERPAATTTIKSIQMALVDTDGTLQPIASNSVGVLIDIEINTFELFYGGDKYNTHTSITTWLGQNGTAVTKGEQYIAYAMALPVGKADTGMPDENAFKDKKIQFTIEALGPDNEHLSFELDADKLAAANPGNVYNWVGGKSYTIRMSLDDGLLVQDITVDDWNEQDIAGGEAIEWVNGFSETGEYEPAQKNADGYYEIKNGGNLFWFANHVNTADRTANAVLTADIDLEGRPWTPIGSTGDENNNFSGVFDGQNYTIRGLNVEGGRPGFGFFGEVREGTVKAIKNCYYLCDDGLAAVHSDSNLKPGSDNVEITAVTEDDLRNNTIATQLGEYWTQGENYPVIKK